MKHLYIITAIFCVSLHGTFAQNINSKKLDSLLNYIESHNKAIGSVSISHEGKEMYRRDFGQKNLKDNTSSIHDPAYQIGSITKMFTAVMIYQLAEKGTISTDDKLSLYFPDLPNSQKITIGNLLSHSSGLGDYLTKQDSLTRWLTQPAKQKDIFAEIKRQGVSFQPGEKVKYSNSGYFLLARILELKYKKPYAEILKKQITSPLALTRTHSTEIKTNDAVAPYRFTTTWEKAEDLYFPNVIGVGDVISTPTDLNKILDALFNHNLIGKASLEKMKAMPGKTFGSGMMQIPFNKMNFYGHGGDTFGTHSLTMYNPTDHISLSLSLNGQVLSSNNLAIAILNIIYNIDTPFPDFNQYTVNPSTLAQYEGTYSAETFPLKLRIFADNNSLKAQANGQSQFELTPTGKDKFAKPTSGLKMEFKPKENKLIFSQGGKEFILSRDVK